MAMIVEDDEPVDVMALQPASCERRPEENRETSRNHVSPVELDVHGQEGTPPDLNTRLEVVHGGEVAGCVDPARAESTLKRSELFGQRAAAPNGVYEGSELAPYGDRGRREVARRIGASRLPEVGVDLVRYGPGLFLQLPPGHQVPA